MNGAGEQEEGPPTSHRPIDRWPYLAAVVPLLLLEYTAGFLPRFIDRGPGWFPSFLGIPWLNERATPFGACLLGVVVLGCTAGLGWLSVRRARTTGANGRLASMAVVPWLQIFAIAELAFSRAKAESEPTRSLSSMRGALWGLAVALAAEIVLTLAFGAYGMALFVGSPFLVGLIASYFAKRDGHAHPLIAAQHALLLASLVLFGFAFEGLFCLFFAYPLAALAALIGGAFGIGMARIQASRTTALSSVALLPLLLVIETAAPPLAEFHDVRSIEVAAPPAAVWEAIVHMGTIREPPAAPFGWGLAFPVAGRIDGEGIGAVRLGVFSTGVAYERVTRWEPGRELWFDVLSDPPMMRETNPFGPVRAPHLDGYFATRHAHFTLTPLAGDRTRLTLATDHALMIGPTSYFEPMARWAVAENKRRVLAHFRDRAEVRN